MINKLGGRKMILAVLSLVALIILAATKPEAITTELIAGMVGIIGLFSATNAYTTVRSLNSTPTPPTPSGVSPEDLTASHLNLQSQIDSSKTQLNQMADIILQLTSKPQTANVVEGTRRGVVNEQANANREAIGQYLSKEFGQ